MYFTAVGAVTPPGDTGPPLTLYELDQTGRFVQSTLNIFPAGEKIWIGIPAGRSGPYQLVSINTTGAKVAIDQGNSLPSNNMMAYGLSSGRFSPNHEYQLQLSALVETSPGFTVKQLSTVTFTVVHSVAYLELRSYSHKTSSTRADISLLDTKNNPMTGVRLALVLHHENSTLQVSNETTDLQGEASFQIGESLATGDYYFEIRDLDQDAVSSPALQLPRFSVHAQSTTLQAATLSNGSIGATLLTQNGQSVQGRLLVYERRLNGGNWTILSSAYTDSNGRSEFSGIPSANTRVSFEGDQFYGASTTTLSSKSTTPISSSPANAQASSPRQPQPATLPANSTNVTNGTPSPTILAGSTAIVQLPTAQSFPKPLLGCPCACPTIAPSLSGVSPNCGGGGGGGSTIPTTTTLQFPANPYYSTIASTIGAVVKDNNGNPIAGVSVNFYLDYSTFISSSVTNSNGIASIVWTPGIYGSHTITAAFPGTASYSSSSSVQTTTINQTPTTIQILQPKEIVYALDLYFAQNGFGLPIVVPVNILALAASGNGAPANIYMPPTSGVSTTPATIQGFGWAGLNLNSTVTLTFNSTFTEIQNMTWTRNFYLPPCPTLPPCKLSPRNGDMYLTATLSPPSQLYTGSSTSLNIPYQIVNNVKSSSSQETQAATPPKHVYVNMNASYPYLSVKMQGTPVSLASYYAWLAYSVQQNPTATVQGGQNVYALPILNSTAGTDFASACSNTVCTSVPTNTTVYLYNSLHQFCIATATDFGGIAPLYLNSGISGCNYPYAYLGTGSTTISLSGLYSIEAISNPSPFYTNFQGYNYAVYAPRRTGSYLLHMFPRYLNAPFTVVYPSTNYADVAYPWYTCCDVFYKVETHPINATIDFNPGTAASPATARDTVKAIVRLTDFATQKPLVLASNTPFTYSLSKTDPGSGVVLTGNAITLANGTQTISLGQLAYGTYVLSISWPGNTTQSPASTTATLIVYKTKPTLILRNVQEPVITFIHPSGASQAGGPKIDGSTQAYCSHTTVQCSATLTTANPNDIIIVYAVEALDLSTTPCTFSVSDTAGLFWIAWSISVNGNGNRDQIQEFWASSTGALTGDVITEKIANCATSDYGGEYNGLIAFGVSGANFNYPFDDKAVLPTWASGTGGSPSVKVTTYNSNELVIAALMVGGASVPSTQSGFNTLTTQPSFSTASEYAVETGPLSNFAVGFGDTAGYPWEMVADAIQPPITASMLPPTGTPYRFYAYVGDDRPLQSSNWSCSWPTYHNCVIFQAWVGPEPATATSRWLLYYWDGNGDFQGNASICSFTSCTPSWSTVSSSFCNGAPYCYYFAIDLCCFSSMINDYIRFSVNAFDIAGQSPIFGSYATGWGFVDNTTAGYFLVNGAKVRPSDLVTTSTNTETFQFNVTKSPSDIRNVYLQINNVTKGTSSTICIIGFDSSCLQPAQFGSQTYILYPATSLVFTNGAYNVTAYFTCWTCYNMQNRLMSIELQFGRTSEMSFSQSPWIQNALALDPYYFRTYIADNATQSFITDSSLSENVYLNDVLFTSLTTNSLGTAFFPWTPQASGQYKMEVRLPSQSYYPNSSYTTTISVAARPVLLTATSTPNNPDVNAQMTWNVTTYDMINNAPVRSLTISQYVDGSLVQTATTDSNGHATMLGSFPSMGHHQITFTSGQTPVYNSASFTQTITAFMPTSVTLQTGTVILGQSNAMTVTLKDQTGSPLSNRIVRIEIGRAFYQNVTTGTNGQAQFTWRPDNVGTFSIQARFLSTGSSDSTYKPSSATATVTIAPVVVSNSVTTGSSGQLVQRAGARFQRRISIN